VGAFLFNCAFFLSLPKGVQINGVDVGGLTKERAVLKVRESIEEFLKDRELSVFSGKQKYVFCFPEIYFCDDLYTVVDKINGVGKYTASVRFYLNGAGTIAENISKETSVERREPFAKFNLSGEPFTYYSGRNGKSFSKDEILQKIDQSLNHAPYFYGRKDGFLSVEISARQTTPNLSLQDVKERTVKLASYTTYFDKENAPRAHNIALACQKINGCVLQPNAIFSFNQTVGKRTAQNGFRSAKVIEGGKFVDGVGGGVCQVSTTLYNAVLLAGLKIKEAHPHSLSVGYVPPSRDAMVSGTYCDLKFENITACPVYIRAESSGGSLTFTIYGKSDGKKYSIESSVLEKIPAPADEIVKGEENKIISYGKDGLISESHLVIDDGQNIQKIKLRRDKYSAVAGIIQINGE